MDQVIIRELINRLERRCSKDLKIKGPPKMKICFLGPDALWLSEEEARVRGKNDASQYYKIWDASEFKDFNDAEDVLNDENQMKKVEKIEVIYNSDKKEFGSWKEFLKWLEG